MTAEPWEGFDVVVLRSGDLTARFAPGVGMVCCSLRDGDDELLGQRGGLAAYAETGSSMGIPLLAPWANRLSALRYRAAGADVVLDPERSPLRLDANGLPIHGVLAASRLWEAPPTSDAARLRARLDFGAHPELLAAFPFAHELVIEASLAGRTLTIETTVTPTGDRSVPLAFGFHPYLQIPYVPRAQWEVTLPVGRRAVLDDRGIPTGAWEPAGPLDGPLGEREFDDLYGDLTGQQFLVRGGDRAISVRFEAGYPYAQVYAPRDAEFVCFEPMTAPTNALLSGEALPVVEPGGSFTARFSLTA